MTARYWFVLAAVLVLGGVLGAAVAERPAPDGQRIVAKGQIAYAMFQEADGKTSGWTSVDNSKAVPGGNGSWNEQRYGELDDNFLVVTKPGQKDWGTLVIPTSRLLQVHFK